MMALYSSPSREKLNSHEHFEDEIEQPKRNHLRRHYLFRRVIPAILTLVALCSLFRTAFVCHHHYNPGKPLGNGEAEEAGNKVPLEIHVMSKCPDARDCLRELIVPTMVQVSEKVDLTMSFIGR